MVESSLDGLSGAEQNRESYSITTIFYYLKAQVLYYLNDYSTMISYLNSVQKMSPKWIAPYMLLAEVFMKQNISV